ncbi:hypothetical protein HHI36_007620 [Cryptolaemus montrouzieri]|uniref:Uncharacterized protein n=1 Tax=Cryptolaemus montrouzieri TaxID=559131 RepID=A0ABD2MQA3_9CUCU
MVNVENNSKLDDEKLKMLREQTREFLYQQRLYSDQQKQFYDNFIANHPLQPYENVKKESFLTKIKHLFKFGKGDKGKEKNLYFKEITAEFLRNEQYYNNQTYFHNNRIHLHQQQLISKIGKMKDEFPINDDVNRNKSQTLVQESRQRSKLAQHQRSRSEDLLMFKEKAKSLEPKSKKSPTGHKTFSNRLKSMVGIGNRRRTKSRDSLTHLTNPVQYFLDHERFNYDIDPEISRKYSRSKSTLDEPDSNGTMRKKTKRFFSTENILHHDQNDKVSNKPPSGRSRKEKRSDEKSDKRRSRTLSPAQKLVSKFKGILNKDAKKTEKDRENWENFMKENKIFMLDHKRFNDSLMQKTLLSSPKTLNKETLISPDRKSVEDPSFFEQNITTTKSKQNENIKPQQIEKPKRSKVEIEAKQPKTHLKSNHELITKPSEINKVSKLGEGKSNFDDPQFVKSQTRIFLHDTKKYHDKDKEPNCIDKTLIFVNNKASPSLDNNGILRLRTESSEKLSKTKKNSINNLKDKKRT